MRKNNLVPGDVKNKKRRLKTTNNCIENHLPIQDKISGTENLIGAKPTDPEAYLLWKKEDKFLSKTAFENALVYLGHPYDEKKLKHLTFSNFTKFIRCSRKIIRNNFIL